MNRAIRASALCGILALAAGGRPAMGQGAVAFAPTIGTVPDGAFLNVTPVVSADRRYVRMGINTAFIDFVQFDTFSIPAAVSGGGFGGGFGGFGGGGGGGLNNRGLGGRGALTGLADSRPLSSFVAPDPDATASRPKATTGRRPSAKRPPTIVRSSPKRRGR